LPQRSRPALNPQATSPEAQTRRSTHNSTAGGMKKEEKDTRLGPERKGGRGGEEESIFHLSECITLSTLSTLPTPRDRNMSFPKPPRCPNAHTYPAAESSGWGGEERRGAEKGGEKRRAALLLPPSARDIIHRTKRQLRPYPPPPPPPHHTRPSAHSARQQQWWQRVSYPYPCPCLSPSSWTLSSRRLRRPAARMPCSRLLLRDCAGPSDKSPPK